MEREGARSTHPTTQITPRPRNLQNAKKLALSAPEGVHSIKIEPALSVVAVGDQIRPLKSVRRPGQLRNRASQRVGDVRENCASSEQDWITPSSLPMIEPVFRAARRFCKRGE
jgi:hypothetical protein